jgi:Transient receptor potential (TRP) ion channel/ML-like domain
MQLGWFAAAAVVLLGPAHVLADNILKTVGYSLCSSNATIDLKNFNIEYDQSTKNITFDISASSEVEQNVTVSLIVNAYGEQVYSQSFNPCDASTPVPELCPVPASSFSASGNMAIPSQYASMIPSIAFSMPDLEGQAILELKSADTGDEVACIESELTNGKTLQMPGVTYAATAIVASSLALSGLTALGTAGHPGSATSSPNFGEVLGWFQTLASSGMLSVQYPSIYRSFTSNFAFAGGLIPWSSLQTTIDNFRNETGGNLTDNTYQYLQNATITFDDGSLDTSSLTKRALSGLMARAAIFVRDDSNSTNSSSSAIVSDLEGIKAWSEQLSIPSSNIFMTVLLFFAIIIAAIAVGILLLKVILETWALYGSFPQSLAEFRKHYWGIMGRTITNLVLIIYGIWVLYCVYQFTRGDSWAAKLLAGLTLALFTALLAGFSVRIWLLARRYKKSEGDHSVMYEDRQVWRRYSLFYDNYKRSYWFLFIPVIVYSFARGCIIAGGDGHGLFQTGGQLVIDALMLILLLWTRPYVAKSSQWINITIQAVRVLSIACILVFVEELGIAQTTKTITGIVLIAVQSTLTVILAILIGVNALINFIRQNPHIRLRERRGIYIPDSLCSTKQLTNMTFTTEKADRDMDNLTPLDARNSLLIDDMPRSRADMYEESKYNMTGPFEAYRDHIPETEAASHVRDKSTDRLISNDTYYRGYQRQNQHMGGISRDRSPSPGDTAEQPRSFGVAL